MKRTKIIIASILFIIIVGVGLFLKYKLDRAVSVIGGADGPTAIFIAGELGDAEPVDNMVNPVHVSSHDEILETDGIDIKLPQGCTSEDWTRIVASDKVIDEVEFKYGSANDFYVYRTEITDSLEDISGMYYDWTITAENPQCHINNEGQGIIIWYGDGRSYSVAMAESATQEKLTEMYDILTNL